eukprot:scaffold8.g1547.t1
MYIESWDSFFQQAQELLAASPLTTRYVARYRRCDGKLVLKVTDDKTCLQFKTDQQTDLKRIEKLNRLFLGAMATGEAPAQDVEMVAAEEQAAQQSKQPAKARRKG